MNGWIGKILKIDLSNLQTEVIEPGKSIYNTFIGGKGLAGYFLKDTITRNWDDPEIFIILDIQTGRFY